MRVGYTDGEKGHSFPKGRKFDTVFATGGPAWALRRGRESIARQ